MYQQTNFSIIIIWQALLSVCDAFHLVSVQQIVWFSFILHHYHTVLFSSLGFAFIARFMIPTDESGEVKDLVQDISLVLLVIISLCCRVFCVYYLVILAPCESNISSMLVVIETVYFIIVPFDPVQKQQNSMRQKMFGIRCRWHGCTWIIHVLLSQMIVTMVEFSSIFFIKWP